MKIKYSELIDQTLYFPTEEFDVSEHKLQFHGIPLMDVVEQFGTPLKFNYIPKISMNINRAKAWFKEAFERNDYKKSYRYCYCTKSSHFKFVLDEALKNDISIETSSAFDMDIVKSLYDEGKTDKSIEVICNGFKTDDYLNKISNLINNGFENITPIIDNYREVRLNRLYLESGTTPSSVI
jgi:arginine decarboxylase